MYFSIDTKILFNMFGIPYVIFMLHAYVSLLRGLTLNIILMKVDNIFVVLWFPDFMSSRKVFLSLLAGSFSYLWHNTTKVITTGTRFCGILLHETFLKIITG